MAKKSKKRTAGKIQTPAVPINDRHLVFSFQYLQVDHPRFVTCDCTKQFYDALFREILRYQKFTVDQFEGPDPKDHRHPITFSEPKGFQNIDPSQDEGLWTDSPWQFGLTEENGKSSGYRIHGFISDETFYIVWFDPKHQLDCSSSFVQPLNDAGLRKSAGQLRHNVGIEQKTLHGATSRPKSCSR